MSLMPKKRCQEFGHSLLEAQNGALKARVKDLEKEIRATRATLLQLMETLAQALDIPKLDALGLCSICASPGPDMPCKYPGVCGKPVTY